MIRPELTVRLPNSPGALAAVLRLLSDEHITIIALSLEASGRLHLVVDNSVRAHGVLTTHHHQVVQQDVLLMSSGHQPGGLAAVLALASSAGVNVNYAYGAGADPPSAVVIGVDDPMRAGAAIGI